MKEAKLKPSYYNRLVPFQTSKQILFNTLSGALITIDDQAAPRVMKALRGDLSAVSREELETLKEDRFLVSQETDELTVLKARSWLGRMRSEDLSLSVLLTLNCNFNCRYCFEQRRPESLSPDTEERIYRFLAKKAAHCDLISIDWYGGEPLLEWKLLKRMNTHIDEICREKGCQYEVSATTNGFLLSEDVTKYLQGFRVSHLQITLDGPPQIHNMLRPTRQQKETFWVILRNIKRAIDDDLRIILRINVLEENVDHVEGLLEVLEQEGLQNRLLFLIKSVVPSSANPCESQCLPPKEFSKRAMEQYRRAVERGWVIFPNLDFLRTFEFCIADSLNQFLIDPRGNLYKCGECFTEDERVGFLKSDGEPELFFERWAPWVAKDPFADEVCARCELLPICMGGCSMKRFWKRKDWCIDIRDSFNEFLQLICLSQQNLSQKHTWRMEVKTNEEGDQGAQIN
jgi:uncharacterized protein